MCAASYLTVTVSVSFGATLAYGSSRGNVGLRETSRAVTFGHEPPLKNAPQRGRWRPVRMIDD